MTISESISKIHAHYRAASDDHKEQMFLGLLIRTTITATTISMPIRKLVDTVDAIDIYVLDDEGECSVDVRDEKM